MVTTATASRVLDLLEERKVDEAIAILKAAIGDSPRAYFLMQEVVYSLDKVRSIVTPQQSTVRWRVATKSAKTIEMLRPHIRRMEEALRYANI